MEQLEFDQETLEKLAKATHEVYCEDLRAKGYRRTLKTDDNNLEHSSLRPFNQLSEDKKEQNRNFAKDIPNKLGYAGFTIVLARRDIVTDQLCYEQVEILAKMEHEHWMKKKLESGWKYNQKTDPDRKLHKALVPWEELSEEDKEKDRTLVKNIPRILSIAKYVMVKVK